MNKEIKKPKAILPKGFKDNVQELIDLRNTVTETIRAECQKFGFTELYGEYADLAKSLGAYSERIENPGQIIPGIARARVAMDEGRPALLEFMTKEENRLSRY